MLLMVSIVWTALLEACEENPALNEFPMPVTLATNLKEVEQMLQFLIVNAKQQSVDKGVVQHISSRIFIEEKFEDFSLHAKDG